MRQMPIEPGDHGAGREKDFEQHEQHAEREEHDRFPTGEPGDVVTEKKQGEADRRNHARPAEPRRLDFHVGANEPAEQQERRQRRDELRDLLKAGGLQPADLGVFVTGLREQVVHRVGDPGGEHRLVVDPARGALGIEREQRALGADDFRADLHLFFFVDERLRDVGVVPLLRRDAAGVAGIVGDRLCRASCRKDPPRPRRREPRRRWRSPAPCKCAASPGR